MLADNEGYKRVIFITDAFSGHISPYFLQTHSIGKQNRQILKDFITRVQTQHQANIKVIRSDSELFSKPIRKELQKRGIKAKPSALNTQA
jgi:hypothetical protein